ncbi:uncharacterized protein LOC128235606 [Mya arenaria]|uniref:uncharacterized protein LOC128235606 n=1 Tax=Mya arenaria TaxID=6604 RepID=UPI0022E5E64A|nr:uncharacterized protein LOC128235606 [Mya arenaria]
MKLLIIVSIGLLAAVDGAARGRRALQAMDAFSLQSFTQLFRQTLLNKIALEMNNTVDMSRDLKVKMDACKVQVTAKTDQCKSAAQSACQADPSFMDYLNAGANLVNPYTYLEGPFNDMASKVGDAVDLLGDKANGFLNSVKDLGGSAVGGVYDGFSSAFNGFKDQLSSLGGSILDAGNSVIDTANLIGDGFTDLGSSIGNVGTDIGHTIGDIGGSIGHAIGGIFGRRELDAQTRQCMEKCAPCRPLLLPTQSDIITSGN